MNKWMVIGVVVLLLAIVLLAFLFRQKPVKEELSDKDRVIREQFGAMLDGTQELHQASGNSTISALVVIVIKKAASIGPDELQGGDFPSIVRENEMAQAEVEKWIAGSPTFAHAIIFYETLPGTSQVEQRKYLLLLNNQSQWIDRLPVDEDGMVHVPPSYSNRMHTKRLISYQEAAEFWFGKSSNELSILE